ncbi:hypothetical protein [Paenibacillus methanolicus]|uniref:ABC-2 type transport system permease protein n=1 Tax=Paenibacillus methanolicus TaxID=582686 RepID=A0A5S5BQZ4_9BACL|nr:hypothetical protein [Paenibacillus methanolicus]TYP69625.1 hypothetical protein BCM02_114142 [Paenibacillus methanolicus]
MAKGTLSLWGYLAKTQTLFLSLPVVVCFISFALRGGTAFSAVDFLAMIGFWTLVFPAAAVNAPLGALHQKELFVSMPISPVSFGMAQPVVLILLYGGLLSGAYIASSPGPAASGGAGPVVLALFAAAAVMFALTCLLINLFKNAAIGLVLSIAYLFYGMFTTGAGQGTLYLFQWFRPRPHTHPDEYAIIQMMGAVVFLLLNYVVIKYRSKLQLTPY